MTAGTMAQQARRLQGQFAAKLAGKTRGPDSGEGRRVPRRNSYEENDPRAKPWVKVGDGSISQGLAHCEALIDTADELRRQLWREYPLAEARRRRAERRQLTAELAGLEQRSPAEVPIGRPATIRMAIAAHDEWLDRSEGRLRRIDVGILRALLGFLDFRTGALFPEQDTIAEAAGCHPNSVGNALKRLKAHGLIAWVRRTTRTGNDGAFGPQLEQTSNAYHFDHRRRMAARTWQRYWQRLSAKLKRLGAARPAGGPLRLVSADPVPLTPLQQALASLGTSLTNATT